MEQTFAKLCRFTTLAGLACISSADPATISIDAADVMHERPVSLIGGNIEDLNSQLYGGLYSQLIYGECFEEHVDPTDLFDLRGPERLAVWVLPDKHGQPVLKHFGGRGRLYNDDGTVSMEPSLGSIFARNTGQMKAIKVGKLTFEESAIFPKDLPPESAEKLIRLATGDMQVSRHWRPVVTDTAQAKFKLVRDGVFTGIQAQEIRHAGGTGEVGIDNAGPFRNGIKLTGGKPYEGIARIKSSEPQDVYISLRSERGEILCEERLAVSGDPGNYQKLTFNLIPESSDNAGRIAFTLRNPGVITIDYAFLQAGEWGRYSGLPIKKDMAGEMLKMGVKTIRYNGSMVNRNPSGPTAYRWKKMIGPVDERQPYHGWFNPYASHGFTLFEFMDFAEHAGLTCMFGVHTAESAQDMADFVEYCLGDATTEWGRRRIANGHPGPYLLQCIQIGNEENADDAYLERLKTLASAIWSKDRSIDVAASNNRLLEATDGYVDLAEWLISIGQQERFVLDSHYRAEPDSADTTLEHYSGLLFNRALRQKVPGFDLRLWPMEENGAVCDWSRGLGHAHNLNTMQRMPLSLERAGTANIFQPDDLYLIWDQGRIHFTPAAFYFQPSYYVDRMFADEWLPVVLNATSGDPKLDVTVKKSGDGKVLTVYVVNLRDKATDALLNIKGFVPESTIVKQIASPDLKARNSLMEREMIVSKPVEWRYSPGNPSITLPAYSFTSIRLAGEEQ